LVVLALVTGVLAVLPTAPASAAVRLPADFVLREIETGLKGIGGNTLGDGLTDFGYLPDETIMVTGKFGKIMWLPKSGAPRHIATIPTNGNGDLGLNGFAVAPDFATSKIVYTARSVSATGPGTGANGVLRLSRWTVTTDQAGNPSGLTGEQTVLQTYADSNVHSISGLVAAPDGTVWVSIGDNAPWEGASPLALRAQDLNDLHGKLIHVNPDGTGVPTNPYYDPAAARSARSLVFASGFRSPFRVSLEPTTGRPIVGDVGNGTIEEINLVTAGNNYGWPCWEGTRTTAWSGQPGCAGVTTALPLYSYPHVGGSSVTGGVVYTGDSYPDKYKGRYFFGDYVDRQMWTLGFNERGELTTPPESGGFGTDVGAPVKYATVPTGGDIVFADIASGKLRRLVYGPGNVPPDPVLISTNDPTTRTVSFDARQSTDPNGDPLTYSWAFGDGQTGAGAQVNHTYAAGQESFAVTLTARDPSGATATKTATVHPSNHAPVITLQKPDPARLFAVGDVIAADGAATDAEDGAVTVNWGIQLIHCAAPADCHQHPGAQQQGPQFRLTFEGHPGDSRLEITAEAIDSKGATTTQTFSVRPKQRRVTINSTTSADFLIGEERTTSGLFTVGSPLTIVAPEVSLDGVATFAQWAEGSTNRVRQVTLPDADQVYEVLYATPIERRYNAEPALRASLGAPTAVEQGDSKVRWRTYATGRMYWSPTAGAHAMRGAILGKYLALGGHLSLGLPTTDETLGKDGAGVYSLLDRNHGIYWHPSTGARMVSGSIHTRYRELGGEGSPYGYPATDEAGAGSGRYNTFQRGAIYWTAQTGAWGLFGGIYNRWNAIGGATGAAGIGFPTGGETATQNNTGLYQHFERGTVLWSPATGAWEVRGAIRNRYFQLGWERSYLGFPKTGENCTASACRSDFQGGYITWNAATGAVTDRPY
jgi:glucose/arabinose dehydrogenase